MECEMILKRSANKPEPLDLDRGLPTNAADVRALRKARRLPPGVDPWQVMQDLIDSLPAQATRRRDRSTSAGWKPFELPT